MGDQHSHESEPCVSSVDTDVKIAMPKDVPLLVEMLRKIYGGRPSMPWAHDYAYVQRRLTEALAFEGWIAFYTTQGFVSGYVTNCTQWSMSVRRGTVGFSAILGPLERARPIL